MASDITLSDLMILEVEARLDRKYDYDMLSREITRRIDGLERDTTCGVHSVGVSHLQDSSVILRIRIREAVWYNRGTALQQLRRLILDALEGIANDVAQIDHIQSMRKLLPIEPTCTGM